MHDQLSSVEKAHVHLDHAVLRLILGMNRQRPWSEAEIARAISAPGHVPASLERLRTVGLVHRWNDLATASHAAVYYHEIDFSDHDSEYECYWDRSVLESLLVRGRDRQGPLTGSL